MSWYDFESNFRGLLFLFLLTVSVHIGYAQKDSMGWFPGKAPFPFLEYDLLEVQPYSGVFALKASDVDYEGVYIPVNLGFRKSFIRWSMLSMQFDFAFGAASYSQFEIIRYDENTLRGGLLNSDFKASGFLYAVKGQHKFRMQFFHVSSHLGDDYMLRNPNFEPNDKSVNYEQLDLIYLLGIQKTELYFGLGYVVSPNAYRDRFMTELGIQAHPPINPKRELAMGFDIKLYEENGFSPDIHSGIGINFKKEGKSQLNLSIDSYYGMLPYSTLDFGKVFWLGLSTKIYL